MPDQYDENGWLLDDELDTKRGGGDDWEGCCVGFIVFAILILYLFFT